jgi:hypothetical protein
MPIQVFLCTDVATAVRTTEIISRHILQLETTILNYYDYTD